MRMPSSLKVRMASATIEPPGGLSRGVSTEVRMASVILESLVRGSFTCV